MIDTSTGEPVDEQFWPDYDTFPVTYSMEDDGRWVTHEGGVLGAANGNHIQVWMPAGRATGTVNVSLEA